jgi:hypothetical protein
MSDDRTSGGDREQSKSKTQRGGIAVNDNGEVEVSVPDETAILTPDMARKWAESLKTAALIAEGDDDD